MTTSGIKRVAFTVGSAIVLAAIVAWFVLPRDDPNSDSSDRLPVLATLPVFQLTDQGGKPFGSKELYDKVWIGNFMFTRCSATCPRQTSELTDLQRHLKSHSKWEQIRLVSISVDPEHDSSQILTIYAKKAGADFDHWKFLTGESSAIRRLCREGFRLPVGKNADDSAMSPTHSSKFILVDRRGRVRGLYDHDSKTEVKQLLADLNRVIHETDIVGKEVFYPDWLDSRRKNQLATTGRFQVIYDFQFEDRVRASGITFRHKIVDDSGRDYKPVHYDHGNGVAIADVDGDGLSDIYFTTQVGSNELWRNLGDGSFQNITESAGVSVDDRVSVAASFADIDNDGDPDLYVTTVREGNLLFENDGKGHFRDVSESSGLNHKGHSSAAIFFDYNRDGLLDLFLVNVGQYTTDELAVVVSDRTTAHEKGKYRYYVGLKDAFAGHLKSKRAEQSILFKNMGNRHFVDVSMAVGLTDLSWSGDASPCDLNEDGWPDLYVLNMQGDDEYYQNVEGKQFIRRSRDLFPKTPWGSMGIKFFDFNNDGNLDLFITDMHSDMSQDVGPDREKLKSDMQWTESFLQTSGRSIFGNAFYRNDGNGQFTELSDKLGAENYWPWGLSVGDLNADGYEDVFIASSMNYPLRYGINTVLLNNRGKEFLDSEYILGIEPRRDGRTAIEWFEVDCSGADRNSPLCKDLTRRAVVWGALGSRSSVIFDLDNDGDLDIVTNDFNSRPLVLISNLAQRRKQLSYLKVRLIGSKSNRDGLGARVEVVVDSGTFTKVHDGQSGYLSQSSRPLYFGLDNAARIKRIRVQWPSGTQQDLPGPIKVNSLLTITEK